MQRIRFAGSFSLLGLSLWLTTATPSFAGGQAVQPQPQPPGGAVQPVPPAQQPPPGAVPPVPGPGAVVPPGAIPPGGGGAAGGGRVGIVGNISIGAMPVTPPPPIGYYAPARSVDYNIGKFFYYPYYYFPHSYWPTQSAQWPERPGEPYMRPPAYMAYPPFREPHWRYELFTPKKYYRGFHFWLDQF